MDRERFEALSRAYGDHELVEKLREFVSEARKKRIESVLAGRLFGVEIAIEAPYDPHNAAAVVRSAEAFGAGAVHVVEAHERVLRAKSTTTGTHRWIHTRHHATVDAFVADVRGRGYCIAAACVGDQSPLEALPVDRPTCLLFGNEHRGLSEQARAAADLRFGIRIFGFAESFNLSVSAALSLQSFTARRRAHLGSSGDLSEAQSGHERARYYASSVDPRTLAGMFPLPEEAAG